MGQRFEDGDGRRCRLGRVRREMVDGWEKRGAVRTKEERKYEVTVSFLG